MTNKKQGKGSSKQVPPHDRFFKKAMGDPDTSKAFIQRHLPPEIIEVIDLNSLSLENEAFVQPGLRSQFTDMLFKANRKDTQIYIWRGLKMGKLRVEPPASCLQWLRCNLGGPVQIIEGKKAFGKRQVRAPQSRKFDHDRGKH